MATSLRAAVLRLSPYSGFTSCITRQKLPWVGPYLNPTSTWLTRQIASCSLSSPCSLSTSVLVGNSLKLTQIHGSAQHHPINVVRPFVNHPWARSPTRGYANNAPESSPNDSINHSVPQKVDKKKQDDEDDDGQPKTAVGGFFRGLVGGAETAAQDEYITKAKEQGLDVEKPQTSEQRIQQHQIMVLKRKKQKGDSDDDDEAQGGHESTIRGRIFSRFKGSPFIKSAMDAKERIGERIEESDNPIINFFRNIHHKMFAETEMAQVVREIRESYDKSFQISDFLNQMERQTIPTILEAYLRADANVLKATCTDDAFRMLNASILERKTGGIEMDPNVLDIDNVELAGARFLEDSPVLIVQFAAQQINCLKDKTGKIIEGAEDDIRAVYYVWAMIQEPDFEDLEAQTPTGGGMGDETSSSERAEKDTTSSSSCSSTSNDSSFSTASKDKTTASDSESKAEAEDASEAEREAKSESDRAEQSKSTKGQWKLMEMVIRGAHSTI